jgi:DNA-binding PadR family transcriptional regulator
MERKGLIHATVKDGKRIYKLSEIGQKALHDISKHKKEIEWLIKSILNKP